MPQREPLPPDPLAAELDGFIRDHRLAERGRELDRDPQFPRPEFRALGEAGWLGLTSPTIYGGRGLPLPRAGAPLHRLGVSGGDGVREARAAARVLLRARRAWVTRITGGVGPPAGRRPAPGRQSDHRARGRFRCPEPGARGTPGGRRCTSWKERNRRSRSPATPTQRSSTAGWEGWRRGGSPPSSCPRTFRGSSASEPRQTSGSAGSAGARSPTTR